MKTRLTSLFIAALTSLPVKSLEAQTLRFNYAYTCKGERIIVTRCRKDSDQPGFDPTPPERNYCAVIYPDRPKQGGLTVETVELRADVIKTLQACDAFGSPESRPTNTGSSESRTTTATASFAPGSAEYYFAEGNRYRVGKDYTKAIASLKRAVTLKPSLTEAQYYVGYCYFLVDDYKADQ
jgi:hypothetical protein